MSQFYFTGEYISPMLLIAITVIIVIVCIALSFINTEKTKN